MLCVTLQFYGVCIANPQKPLLVMELCAHGSLYDVMLDQAYYIGYKPRKCPAHISRWKEAIRFLKDIFCGIQALHDCTPPIFHR